MYDIFCYLSGKDEIKTVNSLEANLYEAGSSEGGSNSIFYNAPNVRAPPEPSNKSSGSMVYAVIAVGLVSLGIVMIIVSILMARRMRNKKVCSVAV